MQLSQLPTYVQTAREIAKKHGSNSPWVLFRLLHCRLRYGYDYQDFVKFNFYSRPISAPKTYIKQPELESLQALVNPKAAWYLVDNKLKFYQVCQKHGLSTPTILGLVDRSEREHFGDGIPHICEPEHLMEIVRREGEGKYLFKPTHGGLGKGITRFERKNDRLVKDSGETIDAGNFISKLLEQRSSFILQKYLRPHPKLRPIMPSGSLGTVRFLTLSTDGDVRIFLAFLKIPTVDNVTDNYYSGRTGNLIAEVDLDSGRLLKAFGPRPDNPALIEEVVYHPDSGETLRGFQIPSWKELMEISLNGATAFRELGTIGWDVALTEDGPCIIEGNTRYGCEQVMMDRGMRPEFESLFCKRTQ